ncbi:hypothetical protein JTB14_028981 [Gonioctena quinquepunctata]|nr:hypothetical protein JTB14_028981 [Gonioctena quinquepunctata]
MKTGNEINVDNYRKLVQTYIDLHVYNSALFWADKVVAITGNPRDVYWLAQCMYLLKQYHRAAHLLRSKSLEKSNILCTYLTARCLFEANELNEALKVINTIDNSNFSKDVSSLYMSNVESTLFDDLPRNQAYSSFLLLKGKILEAMDNRGLAADCYQQALHCDVYCFEAFDSLIKYQMLTSAEEEELLKSLPISEQCTTEEAEILQTLYEAKLKKYHTPVLPKPKENKILFGNTPSVPNNRILNIMNLTPNPLRSLPIPPVTIVTPTSVSTPNVERNNDKNLKKNELQKIKNSNNQPMQVEPRDNSTLLKLKNSLDLQVAEAERLYYNCDYQQCSLLTEAILKIDPYHDACLPVHISCQVELKQSNKLFSLAHNLVDLYPNLALSWFAVGCYYYIIGKSDFARRYLAKATCLDRLFGPAWLAYGHSFAIENEHDQAMAAYFKASQLMKGCHLPLLYIGLECGLTNNVRLADRFFQQAQNIAPDDPFIMHEKGVISFQNLDFEAAEMSFKDALRRVKKIKKGIVPQRWAPLLNNLGHTCRKLKKYGEALEFHNQALLLTPQSASTYSALAYVQVLMGNYDEAVEWFHKALGLKRDDTFSTTMLNYVIEQLTEEKPPYPDCPSEIPKFSIAPKASITVVSENITEDASSVIPSVNNEMSEMSMSIEVDMVDATNRGTKIKVQIWARALTLSHNNQERSGQIFLRPNRLSQGRVLQLPHRINLFQWRYRLLPLTPRGSSSALRKTQRTTGQATQRESLMGKTIKLIQANLQHEKAASYTISRRFANELLDLALIQEPWTTGPGRINGLGNIPGKVIFHSSGNKPRACILLRKNINGLLISDFCSEDVVTAQLTVPTDEGQLELTGCSAYFAGDIGAENPPTLVKNLVRHCEGLNVQNISSEPTFVTSNGQKVLDLTVSKRYISNKIINWYVSTESSCSDHRHIRFDVGSGTRQEIQYWDPKCTDWEGFRATLRGSLGNDIRKIRNSVEIELAANHKLSSDGLSTKLST